ncbi:glycosyltransferase family 2 protein [Bacillus sp. JZ8]
MSKNPLLTVVVPCYNEEEVLEDTMEKLHHLLEELINEKLVHPKSNLLFVDDGSRDKTWSMIAKESVHHPWIKGLKLARNVGHQKALIAGLEKAAEVADCAISIDADLQDDIKAIKEFLVKFHEGYDIVYGVRRRRTTDTFFKRSTALGFYRCMNKLGIELIYNHADFRLMSKRALTELRRYKEKNLFLRGIIPLIGLNTAEVFYDRKERLAGESKYPLKKMLSFAFDGITSFSVKPIRFITYIGFFLFLLSGFAFLYAFVQKLLGSADSGWTSIIVSLWFLGGLNLIGIGVVGEYIGKIFTEVKARPHYGVDIDLYTGSLTGEKSEGIEPAVLFKEEK